MTQDIALIKHFREHLAVLSDPRALDLLSLAATEPITNTEARSVLKVGRNVAWIYLSRLVQLGMLEKRGQVYRASNYAADLLYATSLTFRSVLNGKVPEVDQGKLPNLLALARQGLEILYERGKIDQEEYAKQLRFLKEAERDV
jgi:hypothetical protein